MSKFLTELHVKDINDKLFLLTEPLIYESDILGRIEVEAGFLTDFASVPRIPIIYELYGSRAHRESVLHGYLFRIDSTPQATFMEANMVFREAMIVRGKSRIIYNGMFIGVVLGGWYSYHRKYITTPI